MRPIGTNKVAWSVNVCLCLSLTTARLVKTDEPIEMLFGDRDRFMWTQGVYVGAT